MRFPRIHLLTSVAAFAGLGLVTTLVLRLSTEWFAAGPAASATALLAASAAVLARPASRRASIGFGVTAMFLFVLLPSAARASAWLGGYEAFPGLMGAYAALLAYTLGAPLARSTARAARSSPVWAACGVLAGTTLPTYGIFTAALIAAALAAAPTETRAPAPDGAGARLISPATCLGVLVTSLTLLGWAVARAPLDPTPMGFTVLVAAALVGAGIGFGGWSAAPALVLMGATSYVVAARLPDLLALGPHAGLLAFGGWGLGGGLLCAATKPVRAVLPAFAAVGAALLTFGLVALPAPIAAWSSRAQNTVWADRARTEAIRARSEAAVSLLGPSGATSLLRVDGRTLAELDGSFADAETRAGAAERFAGTLAGCAAQDRGRARVGGDDLGLAVEALRAQSFIAIDTAIPSAALVRALAAARPTLERTWLHPSVRLVSLPAPAVLAAGPRADAVVEIVRTPWTDGRRVFPSARTLAATRATLSEGGAHILALGATALPNGALPAVIADFLTVYPGASLWLPPAGADTALLLGRVEGAPLPWSGLERCVAADRKGLAAVAVRSAIDLGALALADATTLAAFPDGNAVGTGLPATLHAQPGLALTGLPALGASPNVVFSDAPAELAGRAESRTLFLEMLREATTGDVKDAIARARALAASPGGDRALEPVLKPHLERARQAMARGAREGVSSKAWEEAEAAIGTARALAPAHAGTLCLQGELAGARGQLASAEEAFEACAKAAPDSLDALDGLARARRSRGNLPGTEEALRAALRSRPDTWTTGHNLGVFLVELGRYDEAERLLKQAVAVQARSPDALAPAPYLALARLYLATDRTELALAQAQRASDLGGGAEALALRGAARFELNQGNIAEEDFRAALAIDPRHVTALGGLGQLHATRGQYELAAASFRAVLEVDAQNPAARENLSRLARIARDGLE